MATDTRYSRLHNHVRRAEAVAGRGDAPRARPAPSAGGPTSPLRLALGPRRWLVLPGFEPLIRQQLTLLLEADGAEGAELIKRGRHRTVWRFTDAEGRYYVKCYRAPDIRAILNANVLGPRAVREWRRLRRALRLGVPSLVPVAVGWLCRGPFALESYLVTLEEPDTEQLDVHLQRLPRSPAQRIALVHAVARLVAHAHRCGMDHRDLHAGNILVRWERDEPRLFLIDLLSARWLGKPVPWPRARRNLLELGVSLMKQTTAAERYRFLRTYLACRPELELFPARVGAVLEEELWRYARFCWWKRDEQCVNENRRFFFLYSRSAHAHASRLVPEELVERLMHAPEELLRRGELLKDSPSSTVVRCTIELSGGRRLAVLWKRFRCSKPLDRLRGFLYRSPALRSWRGGNVLLTRGIPTPRPLVLIETKRWGIVDDAYLMTEYVDGARTLVEYVRGVLGSMPPRQQSRRRWELAARLGEVVGQLHRCCVSHRDLKFPNWMVVPDGTGRIRQLYVIDLAGLQVWKSLPRRRRVQNIARLLISAQATAEVSATECLRFLRAYLPEGLRRGEWKGWWRAVESFARRKVRRNRRWGRTLS